MRIITILFTVLLLTCGGKQSTAPEKAYPMTATIVSRDPAGNIVTMDHKDVPGVMEAMRMDYELRGAKVATLPPDGTPVEVTLHEQEGRFWVTDVKPRR